MFGHGSVSKSFIHWLIRYGAAFLSHVALSVIIGLGNGLSAIQLLGIYCLGGGVLFGLFQAVFGSSEVMCVCVSTGLFLRIIEC